MKKISIVTVCYNSSATINETIESVLSQKNVDIEYVIVDGLSNDGTQEIVKSFGDQIHKFVSEKDKGLYDAMNKGIALCTGEIIGILNSDDLYFDDCVIQRVVNEFEAADVDCVFGDLFYFANNDNNKPLRYYKGRSFSRSKVPLGILPPHPTFFVKQSVYKSFGVFDTQFKYAADFDLMARFLYVHKIAFNYIPQTLVKMRIGGVSTQSLKRIIEINKEDIASCKKNKIKTNFLLFHIKYLFKVFHIATPRYFFNTK